MSYTTRENKRKAKVTDAKRETVIRSRHRDPKTQTRWFLTIASRKSKCKRCGGRLRPGREIVFRFEPKTVFCPDCAQLEKIDFRHSQRWEKSRRKKKAKPKQKAITYTPTELVAELVIEASIARNCTAPTGAWTRSQFAAWGIPYPPPKGWRRELVNRWSA